MIVTACPHCASRFRLPEDRIGRGGARVQCPACEEAFDWLPSPVGAEADALPRADAPAASAARDFASGPVHAPGRARDDAPHGATAYPAAASAVDELEPDDATPALVARLTVEELVNAGAEPLLEAYDRGVLFSSYGPELLAAWQRCRDRLGAAADAAEFRAALSERLGVDLPGWTDRR